MTESKIRNPKSETRNVRRYIVGDELRTLILQGRGPLIDNTAPKIRDRLANQIGRILIAAHAAAGILGQVDVRLEHNRVILRWSITRGELTFATNCEWEINQVLLAGDGQMERRATNLIDSWLWEWRTLPPA